jgi:hypothetical protein
MRFFRVFGVFRGDKLQSSRLAQSRRVLTASPLQRKLRADPQHNVIDAFLNAATGVGCATCIV